MVVSTTESPVTNKAAGVRGREKAKLGTTKKNNRKEKAIEDEVARK